MVHQVHRTYKMCTHRVIWCFKIVETTIRRECILSYPILAELHHYAAFSLIKGVLIRERNSSKKKVSSLLSFFLKPEVSTSCLSHAHVTLTQLRRVPLGLRYITR